MRGLHWKLWLVWVVVTGLSLGGGLAACTAVYASLALESYFRSLILFLVLLFPPTGLVVGTAQWVVLRRHIAESIWWIPSTMLGLLAGLGGAVAVLALFRGGLAVVLVSGAVWGAFFGLSQWFVLQHHFRGAGWWLVATLVSTLAGMSTAWVMGKGLMTLEGVFVGIAAGLPVSVGLYAVVTGFLLVWLTQEQRQTPPLELRRFLRQLGAGAGALLLVAFVALMFAPPSLPVYPLKVRLRWAWPGQGPVRLLQGDSSHAYSVAWSPDGDLIASAGRKDVGVRVWRASDGSLVRTLPSDPVWANVAFSPDGRTLAAGDRGVIKLWQVDEGHMLRAIEENTVFHVAFSPDGATLATAAMDRKVRLWRVADGAPLHTLLGHTGSVYSVAFAPDGQQVASASADRTVKLWNVADGTLVQTLPEHGEAVTDVAFSPDGRILASASGDNLVRLWRVRDGSLLHELEGHTDTVYRVVFSPDGRTLASGSWDTTVRLWGVDSGTLESTLVNTSHVKGVAFAPDGKFVAVAAGDGIVALWKREP